MPEEACGNKQKNPRALTIPVMWARMIRVLLSIPIRRASTFRLQSWACGAAGSALPWHGRGRRFDPDQVHQLSQRLRPGGCLQRCHLCRSLCRNPPFWRLRQGFPSRCARLPYAHGCIAPTCEADVTCNCHDCGVRRTVRIILSTELSILPFQNARRSDSRRNTPAAGCSWSGS
jgi:hypothetical protein